MASPTFSVLVIGLPVFGIIMGLVLKYAHLKRGGKRRR